MCIINYFIFIMISYIMHLSKLMTDINTNLDSNLENNIITITFSETLYQDYKGDIWNDYITLSLDFIIKDNLITYNSNRFNQKLDGSLKDNNILLSEKRNEEDIDVIYSDMILVSEEVINYNYDKFIKFVGELYDFYKEEQMANIDIEKEEFINYIKEDLNM